MGLFNTNPILLFYLAIILLVSIGLHEYAHALSSYKLGDPTPKLQKRLTPNPIAHIDPFGFLMIFLVHFGRGKPVEVNPAYYKNPVRDELIVALAGPFTNFLLAIMAMLITIIYLMSLGLFDVKALLSGSGLFINLQSFDMITLFWTLFAIININLAIFNLLPVPPLDGYRLILFFNPRLAYEMKKNMFYIFPILIVFLFTIGATIITTIGMFIFELMYTIIFLFFS